MHSLRIFLPDGIREIQAQDGQRISDALQSAGIAVSTPCGGSGTCGKCRLQASGALVPPPDGDGLCLACQTRIHGPADIRLGQGQPLQAIEGMAALPEFDPDPLPGQYGLAVDIGTTTLAMQLISLQDGKMTASIAAENPQRCIAHDVIGRIQASLEGRGDFLQGLIQSEIRRMTQALCARGGIEPREISQRVYTGNTAMLYLLTGRNPASLAAAPFAADCLFDLQELDAYLPPCFGAYVGADIACALLSSDLLRRHRTAMLIDIGTNGEICLMHDGKILCCATAAGPAFEGAGISCGVSSVEGAIEAVAFEEGSFHLRTIGNAAPVGLCGSGLIDAVAALLKSGLLDETGYLEDGEVHFAPGVSLNQKDIRMVQLAKGSICAGMQALLDAAGLQTCDVEQVYIAGGFGRHINILSALRIGLLPPFAPEQVQAIGNAALAGAAMLLLKRSAREEIRSLTKRTQCINLAHLARFQILYPEAMLFPEE